MTIETVSSYEGAPRPAGLARRIRNLILGPPISTEKEKEERLSNPIALAILSSDALSSVAYATEEMVKVLLPVAGIMAFSYVMPISGVIIVLLLTLVFSYRQTIKAYPSAGGAYIVTRDNFGLTVAQVAGVALLLDYILTVAVSMAAGVAAIYSAFPSVFAVRVPLTVALIWLIAWGNLRGVRMTGKLFCAPTFLFVATIAILIIVGLLKWATGTLHPLPPPPYLVRTTQAVTFFVLLHAYASGTTALTGVEAISNGVPIFRPVEWRNARKVLTTMGFMLIGLFGGISLLAWRVHPVPSSKETLVSLLGRTVFGGGHIGHGMYLLVQVATTVILIMAANTSYADFPRLASFHAGDDFLPRPFRHRGQRLVFSTGIIVLAVLATVLTIVLGADVHRLIPLYAVGVFASFTFSQAGMTRRHLRLREEGWRKGLAINAFGALGSGAALIAITVTKFTSGAWVIIILIPLGVSLFLSIHRHYQRVDSEMAQLAKARFAQTAALDVVVLMTNIDEMLEPAVRYVEGLDRVADVHLLGLGAAPAQVVNPTIHGEDRRLVLVDTSHGVEKTAEQAVRQLASDRPDRTVTVVVPYVLGHPHHATRTPALRPSRLRRALLDTNALVVGLPVGPHSPLLEPVPVRRATMVLVNRLDVLAVEAIRVGRLLGGHELHAIHFDVDREETDRLVDAWPSAGLGLELEVAAAEYRALDLAINEELARLRAHGVRFVTVVIPRLVPRWWQRPLYGRSAEILAATLRHQPDTATLVLPRPVPRAHEPVASMV